jgi:hypothetical protein
MDSFQPSDKLLLFSFSVKLLNLLEKVVTSWGMDYLRLDGTMGAKKRFETVEAFNSDPSIQLFLISTRAGGTGLNMTGANKVVIFDPNWNPAWDLQAQDRAFRLGQKRDVSVYRFISAGTLEEHIYRRQVLKQQMANMATTDANQRRFFNPDEELMGIDNLMRLNVGACTDMERAVQRASKIEVGLQNSGIQIEEYGVAMVAKGDGGADGDASTDTGGDQDGADGEDLYDLGLLADELADSDDIATAAGGAAGLAAGGRTSDYLVSNHDLLQDTGGEDAAVLQAMQSKGLTGHGVWAARARATAASASAGGIGGTVGKNAGAAGAAGAAGTGGTGGKGGGGTSGGGCGPAPPATTPGGVVAFGSGGSDSAVETLLAAQFQGMANKFGFRTDTLKFAQHWTGLDRAKQDVLIAQFYGSAGPIGPPPSVANVAKKSKPSTGKAPA